MLGTGSDCSHIHPYSSSAADTQWSLCLRILEAGTIEDYNYRAHLRVEKPFPKSWGEDELCPPLGKQVEVLEGRREPGKACPADSRCLCPGDCLAVLLCRNCLAPAPRHLLIQDNSSLVNLSVPFGCCFPAASRNTCSGMCC